MATDSVQLEMSVGPPSPLAVGSVLTRLRAGKFGEQIVGAAHAEHYEAAARGNVYCACNQAEVTWGTALTATAVTFTLWNPLGSPVDLVILTGGATMRTAGTAGHLVWAANTNPAAAIPATNTELTVRNAMVSGPAGYGKAYSATTLPAAPVAIRTFCAPTTAAGIQVLRDYVNGAIILTPNTAVTIQGITVVGTGLVDMFWEEVPRVAA